jgi:hypothetical protein
VAIMALSERLADVEKRLPQLDGANGPRAELETIEPRTGRSSAGG